MRYDSKLCEDIAEQIVSSVVKDILDWEARNLEKTDNENARWVIGEIVSVVRDCDHGVS